MIRWILLGLLLAWLAGTGALGLLWRGKRAKFDEGFGVPFLRGGVWFAVATGILSFSVAHTQWAALIGFGAGLVFFLVALGWDEFYDRIAPGFYACLRREVGTHFTTSIPYFVLFLFVLLSGIFFWAYLKGLSQVTLRYALQNVSQFGIFLFPLLTMGAFAREKAEGTVEVLMTAPVSDISVVASKFLGIMTFYLVMLLPTVVYYGVLRYIGTEIGKPDAGPVLTAYVGMVFLGAFFISMGMFASSLTSSQILAALLSWVFLIFFLIAEGLVTVLGVGGTPVGEALAYLSPLGNHLESFLTGVIDPKDVVYFLSFVLFFLFLSVRSVESRKWR